MVYSVNTDIGGRNITLETGLMAKQANGAVMVRYGDTMILATATAASEPAEDADFFPLTVEYREKAYAAGRIPGGFFKREGRPMEKEILISRLIDRPLRPLFPDAFKNEVQIITTVLSADELNSPDIPAIIGASTALYISSIPFEKPIGAVRVGLINGEFIINPTYQQLLSSDLDLVMAGTEEEVIMVESGSKEITEEKIIESISFGNKFMKEIIRIQKELAEKVKVEKWPLDKFIAKQFEYEEEIRKISKDKIKDAINIKEKRDRKDAIEKIFDDVYEHFERDETKLNDMQIVLEKIEREEVRRQILQNGTRIDGRKTEETRPISCAVGILPRTHGSALFTRGETQALVVVTLGTKEDEQKIEDIEGESFKQFMLHYNFPPFSVGEVRPLRSPGRREIGHGALAERAILPVIPSKDEFPYTLRVVSDILESNGSSSMATVCGATLSLMDAGVPIKAPVAGIAMGLVKEGEEVAILTDIMGSEDHYGDMDFKVAGTSTGITSLQMDIKISGVDLTIMERALKQAKDARSMVLERMIEALPEPREELSVYAPRIISMRIKPEKIREVIGPGGKVVRSIVDQTGVKIDIEDDGRVSIYSSDSVAAQKAVKMINDITEEVELDKIYLGKVKKIVDFGAFVEILPGTDGLLHISQIADYKIRRVEDEMNEGDEILVKVIEIDPQGRIKLSRKAALKEQTNK